MQHVDLRRGRGRLVRFLLDHQVGILEVRATPGDDHLHEEDNVGRKT